MYHARERARAVRLTFTNTAQPLPSPTKGIFHDIIGNGIRYNRMPTGVSARSGERERERGGGGGGGERGRERDRDSGLILDRLAIKVRHRRHSHKYSPHLIV